MTEEQQRTLDYYEERWQHHVMRFYRGHVKTTADWWAYTDACTDYFGYRKWLDTYVTKARVA